MSELKLKCKQDSWFYSHLGHHLPGGNIRRSLPQVFACYLFTMNNFSHLYRNSTMSEFKFFMERVDRWGNSMQALWGNLGICPPTDHIGLPHHTVEELHSIGCLKVWGDVQKLHLAMVYLLVQVDDTSEARTYGMAIVWINSLQARMFSMVEALEMLSSHTSEGSDWPYVLIQLYEGTNHMPLPKDRHVCILPQGKAESPSGQISQLKIGWLLSTGPSVVFPIELNGVTSRWPSICQNHCTLAPVSPLMSILTSRSTSLPLFQRSRMAPRWEAQHSNYHSAQNSLEA